LENSITTFNDEKSSAVRTQGQREGGDNTHYMAVDEDDWDTEYTGREISLDY